MANPLNTKTVDEFISAFPNSNIPKIQGEPTYETLNNMRTMLQANATSVSTTLGGGRHGHLGATVSAEEYVTITATAANPAGNPYDAVDPPPLPAIAGAAAVIAQINQDYAVDYNHYKGYVLMQDALKKQIQETVDNIYLEAIREQYSNFANLTAWDMINHLFTNYAIITPLELQQNNIDIVKPWDPTTPFATAVKQISDCQNKARTAGQPYSDQQIMTYAYNLVFSTNLYFNHLERWNARAVADKTYDHFKTFIAAAQLSLRNEQRSAAAAGFNLQTKENNQDKEALKEITEAFAAYVEATSTGTNSMAELIAANAKLVSALQDKENQLNKLTTGKPDIVKTPRPPFVPTAYCHTHGFCTHSSGGCRLKGPEHKDEATADNRMGGSAKNMAKWNKKS